MKNISFYIKSFNWLILVIAINVAISFLPKYQLDLTGDKIHSLSKASVEVIRELKDLVKIKVFLSEDLPPQYKPMAKDLKNILLSLSRVNPDKFVVEYGDPSKNQAAKDGAEQYGIQPLQFSSVKSDKFEVQTGYFGLVLIYGSKQEVLPVAGDIGNLEYFVISTVKKLTADKLPTVAVSEETSEAQGEIQYIRKFLEKNYKVVNVNLNSNQTLPEMADSLLVVGQKSKIGATEVGYLIDWVNRGKGLIVFQDVIGVDQNMRANQLSEVGWEKMWADQGMKIETKLVVDESATVANFRTQNGAFFSKYPYWPQILRENINSQTPVTSGISSLTLAWASPIILSGEAKPLFASSQSSAVDDSFDDLSPISKKYSAGTLNEQFDLGAINTKGVRMALVADSDMIKDNFVANNQQNLLLVLNLVDYFSQDTSLLGIRSKMLRTAPIRAVSDQLKGIIKVTNLLMPLLLLGMMALIYYLIKKKKGHVWTEE